MGVSDGVDSNEGGDTAGTIEADVAVTTGCRIFFFFANHKT